MDSARKALRAAIEQITSCPGQILEGTYSSKIDGFFDIENVIFCNIEVATFRNSGRYGLRARRSRDLKGVFTRGFSHKMDYRLIPRPETPLMPVVHLQFEPTNFRSVFDVWWAAANGTSIKSSSVSGRYGLYVELSSPVLPSNPAGKMKILFDGVIAAVQKGAAPNPEVERRLSLKHRVDVDLIRARFLNPVCSSIKAARDAGLVRPYRAGVQWYPADELCDDCTLIVTENPQNLCDVYIYQLPDAAALIDKLS